MATETIETHETEQPHERRHIDCPVLVTERLVLRPPHEDDIDSIIALAGNAKVAEMTASIPHPYGEADARRFLAMAAKRESGCHYAVTLAENGAFIGGAGIDAGSRGLRLGYWLGEPFWGKGYASEAAAALVELAFRATDIETLHVACRTVNPASKRVIEKCGFTHDGFDMIDSIAAGRVEVERFTLAREDWLARMAGA